MSEQNLTESELNPNWQELAVAGIKESLENYQLFDQMINLDPTNLTSGQDERDFRQLSEQEKQFIITKLFDQLGFNPKIAQPIDTYTTSVVLPKSGPAGKDQQVIAAVKIYQTSRSETDHMFLHEINIPTGEKEYFCATDSYRL